MKKNLLIYFGYAIGYLVASVLLELAFPDAKSFTLKFWLTNICTAITSAILMHYLHKRKFKFQRTTTEINK